MILILKKPSELNTERPPVFCRDYIPIMQSSVSMIYSGGGVGKSFLAIRMAIVYVIETGNKVALWLSEDSEGENWFRYSSLVQQDYPQHKKTLDEKITFISTKPVQFTSMHDGNAVLTKEFWQVRLELSLYSVIFFDPLLQFNGGDENSNTHAGVLMGALKEWSGDEDKSLVLIHHASKSKEGGIRPRGAGEWTNGCRSVFSVAKITDRDGELDRNHTNNLTVTLVKDNGLSYVFSNETTGEIEKSLRVFPDYDYESARGASPEPHKLFLSIASHNSAKKPDGFIKVELETFYETHKFVTHDKAYSQYEFKGGYRLGANNQGNITMVCLDFDDGMTIERAKEKFSKVQSLIVTTRSHQIMKSDKKCDRFRVIMPLESPLNIPLSDYPGFLDCLSEATGGEVDPSTKDLARFYFASPKNATYHYSDSDKRLNWRPIYDQMKRERVTENIKKKMAEKSRPRREESQYRSEPQNTLAKGTMFETKNGTQSFESLRDTLSVGEKESCKCVEGIDHGGMGMQHFSAFVKKDTNGNVFYSCSGGRCSHNGTLWCADWHE